MKVVVERCKTLLKEFVTSPSLKMLKTQLDAVLGSLVDVSLLEQG